MTRLRQASGFRGGARGPGVFLRVRTTGTRSCVNTLVCARIRAASSHSRRAQLRKPRASRLSHVCRGRARRKRQASRTRARNPAASRRGRRVNTTIDFCTLPCPALPSPTSRHATPRQPTDLQKTFLCRALFLFSRSLFRLHSLFHCSCATGRFRG